MIHVTVVSSNPALRLGLRALLESPGIKVLGEAADLDGVEAETEVLVLASAPPLDWIEGSDDGPAVLLLTEDLLEVEQLARAGLSAWGALSLNATEDELLAAVHALGQGLWVGAPALIHDKLRRPRHARLINGEEPAEPLTPRETEVLQLVAQGLTNKQVALALSISEHTVKFHLSSLYTKLGVASRTEALREGMRRGLIVI